MGRRSPVASPSERAALRRLGLSADADWSVSLPIFGNHKLGSFALAIGLVSVGLYGVAAATSLSFAAIVGVGGLLTIRLADAMGT